jgi:hypothetical protein
MRKTIMMVFAMAVTSLSFAAIKSTGLVSLGGGMSAKFELNTATSKVTVTMVGPSNTYLALALNTTYMQANSDCLFMRSATNFSDEKLPGGHTAPTADAVNNWTIVSNTTAGTTRTIVATRGFVGDSSDYTFTSGMTTLNVAWAVGSAGSFSGFHGGGYGSKALTFATTLGLDDFVTTGALKLFPNPSPTGFFNITKANEIALSRIRIYDINAQLLKEVTSNLDNNDIKIDLSNLARGTYFAEISNNGDQTVKKIVIE